MQRILGALVLVLILAGVAWYLFGRETQIETDAPIKIGVASLLNGDFAVVGENIVKTARLAAEDINTQGGINGRPVELVIEDAGYTSRDGVSAIQKLVNADGIRYVIGGMSSNGTVAAAPIANQTRTVILTPVTGGKNVDEAGDYIFRIANADVLAGQDLANAMLRLGYKRAATISEVTEYTTDIQNTFEKTFKEKGGTIVMSERFQPDTTDYRTLITSVRESNPEAILVLSQLGTNAAQFIKQSRELGFTPPLFTDFTLAANGDVKRIVGSLDGIYFADPAYDSTSESAKSFFKRYEEKYGGPSPIPFHSASTYDGMMLFAAALRAVGDDSEGVQGWLIQNVKNYRGLMGTYSLNEAGNSDLGFTVRVIKNGAPAEVVY